MTKPLISVQLRKKIMTKLTHVTRGFPLSYRIPFLKTGPSSGSWIFPNLISEMSTCIQDHCESTLSLTSESWTIKNDKITTWYGGKSWEPSTWRLSHLVMIPLACGGFLGYAYEICSIVRWGYIPTCFVSSCFPLKFGEFDVEIPSFEMILQLEMKLKMDTGISWRILKNDRYVKVTSRYPTSRNVITANKKLWIVTSSIVAKHNWRMKTHT